jgi:hypothetical protein
MAIAAAYRRAALMGAAVSSSLRLQVPLSDDIRGGSSNALHQGHRAQSESGILVAGIIGNVLQKPHDPAPQGDIINSHERSDQP